MKRGTGPQLTAAAAGSVILTAIALAGAARGCTDDGDKVTATSCDSVDTKVIIASTDSTTEAKPREGKNKRREAKTPVKPMERNHRDEVVSD